MTAMTYLLQEALSICYECTVGTEQFTNIVEIDTLGNLLSNLVPSTTISETYDASATSPIVILSSYTDVISNDKESECPPTRCELFE